MSAGAARRVAVITGTRADFGLLREIMEAIDEHPGLLLEVIAAGAHLLPPARTLGEVRAAFDVAAVIEMQREGATGRGADAAALGRGVSGFAARFAAAPPDIVLVLGDRIEAFGAAAAASVAGVRVAHLHGGDRAEGIADEALRHAITKLAHVHLPATAASARRIVAMGEEEQRVHVVGSPAVAGALAAAPLDDETFAELGAPRIVVLLHPTGADPREERRRAELLLAASRAAGRVLALDPNHDPGREGIVAALDEAAAAGSITRRAHLPRPTFLGLLRRAEVLAGNSSAGLIECAVLPRRCVNVGSRQAGRERAGHVIDCPTWRRHALEEALRSALDAPMRSVDHPFGNGDTAHRTAALLASLEPDKHRLTKRNTY